MADRAVCIGRADDVGENLPLDVDIVHIVAGAGQEAPILDPTERRPDERVSPAHLAQGTQERVDQGPMSHAPMRRSDRAMEATDRIARQNPAWGRVIRRRRRRVIGGRVVAVWNRIVWPAVASAIVLRPGGWGHGQQTGEPGGDQECSAHRLTSVAGHDVPTAAASSHLRGQFLRRPDDAIAHTVCDRLVGAHPVIAVGILDHPARTTDRSRAQ